MTENLSTRPDAGDADLRALATLDPAGPRDHDAHRSADAQAMLAAITSGTSASASSSPARRRWPWLAAAAAVTAGVVVVAPSVGSRGGAYAGWTDVPAAATAADAAAAEDGCREMWLGVADPPGEGLPALQVIENAELILAEQRGDYTYTVLADGGWAMDCLVQTRTGFGWGGGGGGAGGSLQPVGDSGELASDGITDLIVGGYGSSDPDETLLMTYARVGADVTAAVVHTPGAGDVEATVTHGYLAAWAPGLPLDALATPTIGITLYLTDGSVVELTPSQVDDLQRDNFG